MNWYKKAKSSNTYYHISKQKFTRFDPTKTAQGILWFANNKEDLISGQLGANISSKLPKYLYECTLSMNNSAGWDEYDKYYIQQLKDMKYDSIILDDTIAVLNPNIISINKVERL